MTTNGREEEHCSVFGWNALEDGGLKAGT